MPKQVFRVRVAMGLSVLIASILVCTGQVGAATAATRASATSPSEQGVTPTTIKIGIVSDLTGRRRRPSERAGGHGGSLQGDQRRGRDRRAQDHLGRRRHHVDADRCGDRGQRPGREPRRLRHRRAQQRSSTAPPRTSPRRAYRSPASPSTAPSGSSSPTPTCSPSTGNGTPTGGPVYSDGGFYKAIGATKISYVESNVSAAITQGNGVYDSIKRDGLQACDKTIVPIGSVNFTAFALSFKADGCNTAECA